MAPRFSIIIPACEEEACIAAVLSELKQMLDPNELVLAVGVNGSTDATAARARACEGVLVAETDRKGYGHGCQAAIDLVREQHPSVKAYIFVAGDGASEPADILALMKAHEAGNELVLGCRTLRLDNVRTMGWPHMLANLALGAWCTLLTGRLFADIGPLRLISRRLMEAMELREWSYGWTIEAQIRAANLGARMVEIPVRERRRLAGRQKVSRVSWRQTLRVGGAILAAGWRTRLDASSRIPAEKIDRCGRSPNVTER